jgi:hypothetical protein
MPSSTIFVYCKLILLWSDAGIEQVGYEKNERKKQWITKKLKLEWFPLCKRDGQTKYIFNLALMRRKELCMYFIM